MDEKTIRSDAQVANSYYIINTNRDCYISLDESGILGVTTNIEKAHKFSSSKKAWNFIATNIAQDKRDTWHVEMKDPSQLHITLKSVPDIAPEDRIDWDEALRNIGDTYLKISNYKDALCKQLSRLDSEQCDILHACEFYTCNVVEGYKLYKMLHDLRIKRRWVKDEIKRAEAILTKNYSEVMSGEIQSSFSAVDNQQYTPRVLKELFEENQK
ncbi:MAG: hypothetical protein LUG23_06015 [Oscillospiraceae bacterium]|nr:hypothetical protein [Oscillospiraceae bacterium]